MPPARYELGTEIARGGMGRVVEATDTELGRTVALKEALALDAESLKRFAREIQITARLEHPSIVPVHDAGTMVGGAPFYVMRKIGGRPLEKLVASADTLNERLALIPHVVAAAQAIAHAHERGIIHRDIKPSNILCGELGETIVIDWGLAKVKGEPDDVDPNWVIEHDDSIQTRAGIVFGTPGFMAPEQLRGTPSAVNERTDVYALGATLYHLLSRRPPHHAKTADEMMRAAAKAPPQPLDELVAGVPPELATIVDKALAHDPRARYQDAKALADDLQRFLTGQLVASHHYTPREKLVRFVRKNRVPVAVAGVGALALLVVGVIAVTRVIGERDRADREAQIAKAERTKAVTAQHVAERQNEQLRLQQARSLVASNPTEAIAMLKDLPADRWREVRSIATAAQVAGVAWSLPAPKRIETLELSHDGTRALIAGDDGSIRIYDLAARTQRVIVDHGPVVRARFADGERRIAIWHAADLAVLDAATGARTASITAPGPIHDLEVVGVNAYWADEDKKLWHLDLAGTQPIEMSVDEPIEQVAPSPDGRWLALIGENHLLLHDRTQPTLPAQELLFGNVRDLDWSDDGAHLAALVETGEATERQVADISVATGGQIVHRVRVGQRRFVAWSGGRMFTVGPLGVGVVSRYETSPRRQLEGTPVALRESARGVVVAGSTGGLALLTNDGDHVVPVPSGRLDIVDASARSPYIVGAIAGRLLVWNIADMLPRVLSKRAAAFEAFTGDDRVLVVYPDTTAEWIDLATHKSRAVEGLPSALLSITGSQDGRACLVDATHHAWLIADDHQPVDLGTADLCVFAGGRPVLGQVGGTLKVVDLDSSGQPRAAMLVGRPDRLIDAVAAREGSWLAAAFTDGTLWRADLATGVQTATRAEAIPTMIAIRRDGTVIAAQDRAIATWPVGVGQLHDLVDLGERIVALGIAGDDHVVAYTDNNHGYVVGLDPPYGTSQAFDRPDVSGGSQSPATGRMVFANRGAIEVLDPPDPRHPQTTAHRWVLAASPGLTFASPRVSGDGRTIVARRVVTDPAKREIEGTVQTALLAWRFAIPATPDDTKRWLDRLTNATFDSRTSNLAWP